MIISSIFFPLVLQTHQPHVCQVLQCLLQHNLYVKTEKLKLHTTKVSFLGYNSRGWGSDGSRDSQGSSGMAYTTVPQASAMILRFCQLLQEIHSELQLYCCAPASTYLWKTQVFFISLSWGSIHKFKGLFYLHSYPDYPWPQITIYCSGGCFRCVGRTGVISEKICWW